jgi:hypothetical protein
MLQDQYDAIIEKNENNTECSARKMVFLEQQIAVLQSYFPVEEKNLI